MGAIIEMQNAAFGYGDDNNVFEGVGFSLEEGEIMSILGPNGCGKSTLLKCINSIFRLREGSVIIGGEDSRGMKNNEIGRRVGYVPQSHDMSFPYTVLEMVLMGRGPHLSFFSSPSQKDQKVAEAAIETLGITKLMDRPYTNISGGEAQLVLIARALAAEPKVLLLDEPTSHLDFRNQMVILDVLERLAGDRNIAAVMTTHAPDHAMSISDKVLLMGNKGKMVGTTSEILCEENLQRVFKTEVKILPYCKGDINIQTIVPIRKQYRKRRHGGRAGNVGREFVNDE
ncbi:MAG: ABC transporter ATP-binding protein [Dehalococcoidia bacterium]|jgi:iron complex transport system ATP-binding protein